MEENNDIQNEVSTASSPDVETTPESKSKGILFRSWALIAAGIGVLVAALGTFLKFFMKLSFVGKFIFITILILFSSFFYVFGYRTGVENGKSEVEQEVLEITNYEVDELDELMNQIDQLRNTLDTLREINE